VTTDSGSPKPDGRDLTGGELSRVAAEVLEAIPFPALVLDVPAERIVASSPAAADLLDPDGGSVVGHLFEEFTADRPVRGIDLLAGGHLNGFETFRILRRPRGADVKVRMWIRSFEHQPASRFFVVVLVAEGVGLATSGQDWQDAPAIVGTADPSLLIDRISSDAEALFNRPIAEMLGNSLATLVTEDDVPTLLAGLSEATANRAGITMYLDIKSGPGAPAMRCEVLLLPLQPSRSCAFVFLPTPASMTGHASGNLPGILLRLGRAAQIADLARGVFRGITEATTPGLSRLTTRELEIVALLLDGDRPPEIATKLFVTQSTVRNHLASVFAKLGVASQQELLTLIRHGQSAHGGG
jgi:DNA-binding CsgD family transcriptional regulator